MAIIEAVLLIMGFLLVLIQTIQSFYIVFKKYDEEDGLDEPNFVSEAFPIFTLITMVILWLTETWFPKKWHIFVFKFMHFIVGFLSLGFLILLGWFLWSDFFG